MKYETELDYQRRIRNLEVAVLGLSAMVAECLPQSEEAAIKRMSEEFFWSVSKDGMQERNYFENPPYD